MSHDTSKLADLAGPGKSTYEEVAKVLPENYQSVLTKKETQKALFMGKRFIEDGLNEALNLFTVEVPLIVDVRSGINDYLDRDGSRTPVDFHIKNDGEHTIEAQVVQAATKWKRIALKEFACDIHEGINTDMRAIRKDYFLDHDHSAYVDQWDWEMRIHAHERNIGFLKETVNKIWKVLTDAEKFLHDEFPTLCREEECPHLPDELFFIHSEEILEMYPDLPRKERETKLLQEHPAVFIIGIGHTLDDGYPHELRAPDYDDWVTPTITKHNKQMYGLNGDILVWNPVTNRRHELSSMGVRVDADSLQEQLAVTGQLEMLELPYHQAVLNEELPLSIGGGIGQSRVMMLLLQKAHIGEVSVTVWPDKLKEICKQKGIYVLE